MSRFRIQWTELHDMEIEAPSLESAINQAMDTTNDVESRKTQNLELSEELPFEEEGEKEVA